MPEREITLEAARFLDGAAAGALDLPRGSIREIARRFLSCAFDGIGKAPALLDGGDLREILAERLPAHFGRRDPLAPRVIEVLGAYLRDLEGRAFVAHAFELHQALDESADAFPAALAARARAGRGSPGASGPSGDPGSAGGAGSPGGGALPPPRPFVNRASKVGRNDPCPCGSGKKFKKCCARLGEGS